MIKQLCNITYFLLEFHWFISSYLLSGTAPINKVPSQNMNNQITITHCVVPH